MTILVRVIRAPNYGTIRRVLLQLTSGYRIGTVLPYFWLSKSAALEWATEVGYTHDTTHNPL